MKLSDYGIHVCAANFPSDVLNFLDKEWGREGQMNVHYFNIVIDFFAVKLVHRFDVIIRY